MSHLMVLSDIYQMTKTAAENFSFVSNNDYMSKKNYIHYNVGNEITYPFLKFNGATVEV